MTKALRWTMRRNRTAPKNVAEISKTFSPTSTALRAITGPASLREALGLSQAEIGRLLGARVSDKAGAYNRSIVSTWEGSERGTRLKAKYVMPEHARQAYRLLLAEVVQTAGRGKYRLWA